MCASTKFCVNRQHIAKVTVFNIFLNMVAIVMLNLFLWHYSHPYSTVAKMVWSLISNLMAFQ